MLRSIRVVILTVCGVLVASVSFAQTSNAEAHFQRAVKAQNSGDYQEALELLELAYRSEPNARYIHRRILVLEKMGEIDLALDVLDDYRDQLVASPEVQNLAVLEQRLRQQADEARANDETADTDIFGWTLVGGGSALVVGGVASLLHAQGEAERLRCSELSNASKTGCDGVDAYAEIAQEQFDQKRSNVSTFRGVGAGLSAVGVAALGWGIYRLASPERPAQASAADEHQQLRATFDAKGGVGVELMWRF